MADPTKSATASVSLVPTVVTPPPVSSSAIRVKAGATTPYTDPQGLVWGADTGFSGTTSTFATAAAISNTVTPAVYQVERYATNGSLQYQFPVANGTYNVKLKFAEIYLTASGLRRFNIVLNGATTESNFDIFAAAGGATTAVDKTVAVNATNGMITIQLLPVIGNPKVNAIEIMAVTPPPTTPPPMVE